MEYESGNTRSVKLGDLYAVYTELYRCGSLTNAHLGENVRRILSWKHWHAPGSAMLALLLALDDNLVADRGELRVR